MGIRVGVVLYVLYVLYVLDDGAMTGQIRLLPNLGWLVKARLSRSFAFPVRSPG